MSSKNYILSAEAVQQKIQRLALEIAEQLQDDASAIVLIGIKQNGVVIAHTIAQAIQPYLNSSISIIEASLNKAMPTTVALSEAVDFNDKNVILCDDVANTGKTLLYALKPLLDFHPKRIQTLALVERMHKLFPIKTDYVGMSFATTLQEHIVVEIQEQQILGAYIQ